MVSDDLQYAVLDGKWTLAMYIRINVVLQFVVYDDIAAPDVTGFPATSACCFIPKGQFVKVFAEAQIPAGIVQRLFIGGVGRCRQRQYSETQTGRNERR